MHISAGNAWLARARSGLAGLALAGSAVAGLSSIGSSVAQAAAGCRTDAIPGRFVDAGRLCASEAAPTATIQNTRQDTRSQDARSRYAGRSGEAVEFPNRAPVSVTMPSRRGAGMRTAYVARARPTARVPAGVVQHSALVVAVARRYRINPRLLASMMRTESSGNPHAISNKGALGLMQVMPGTARSLGIAEPRAMLTNPALAMSAGAAYLKRLQGQLGNDVPLVVAAYNAGPGAVLRAKRRVPRYRETQGYVRSVMGGFARPRR